MAAVTNNNTVSVVFSLVALLVAVIAIVIGVVSLAQRGTYNYNIVGGGNSAGKTFSFEFILVAGGMGSFGGHKAKTVQF